MFIYSGIISLIKCPVLFVLKLVIGISNDYDYRETQRKKRLRR